uniref:Peptidase S1 domain-containing protein n=1 Tax=Megaselia scalaris TaxID=36166 RepID=T1H1C8_MEGSC
GVTQQVGIVSWGYVPCGESNLPSVYTRVSAFTEWIVQSQADYYKNLRRWIFAGITNNANRSDGQEVFTNYAYVHEKYTGGVGPYDIAILHLETPLVFNDKVKPIALPYETEVVEGKGTLYGWGRTNSSLPVPEPLQRVDTTIMQFKECKAALPSSAPIHEVNVCSSSLNAEVSACNGDSGGPFVKEDKNGVTQQVGIVSWGYVPCGESNLPSVYTRVSAFTEWIVQSQADYYKNRNYCR